MISRIAAISGMFIVAALCWQHSGAVASGVNADKLVQSGHVYLAEFSAITNRLKVAIDGVSYSGYITSHADQTGDGNESKLSGPLGQGKWGRAFLFASSAKVIQCRIDSGLPELIGSCIDADGRNYKLLSSH